MNRIYIILTFLLLPILSFAQHKTVQGFVVDHTQTPIEHTSVIIEGTTLGTTTDDKGHFTLEIPSDNKAPLVFRAIGYLPTTHKLTNTDGKLLIELKEDNLNISEVVVSATRYGVERRKAPVIVNVLSPKLFRATQSVAMSETLNYQPGVRVENNCSNCGFSQVRLNGLEGAYSQILINSRAIFSALNSVYGLDQIPTSMIDRIEVVRSGGSALFGANAIAGTINIITKDPIENDWQIKSTNSLIDGKSWDNTIDFNTSYVDTDLMSGVTFYGMHRTRQPWDADGDGFSNITKMRNTTFGTKAFLKFTEQNKLTFDLSTINEFRRGGDKLHLAPHFTDITEQAETHSLISGLTYDHYSKDFSQKLSVYASGQLNKRESYYGGLAGERELADTLQAANSYGDTDDQSFIAGGQYTKNFDKDVFTAGAEYNYNWMDDKIPGYGRSIAQITNGIGTYAQYEWNPIERLKTLFGARYDYTKVDGNYTLPQIQRTSDKGFGNFSPRLTVLYDFNPVLQFRGGFARGFRAPQAFSEDMHVSSAGGEQMFIILGEDLKSEYSNAYTASLNFTHNEGPVQQSLLIEGFLTDLKDPFTNVQTGEGDGIIIQETRNGAGAYVYGTNIEWNIAPTNTLSMQLGGTLQKSKYKEDQIVYENDDTGEVVKTDILLRSPNSYGYLNGTWQVTKKTSLFINSVYTGGMRLPHQMVDESYVLKESKDFIEINARASYTFSVKKDYNIELFGGIQNIFNAFQKDLDTGALKDPNYIYGPTMPRVFTFGVKIGHFH